MKYQAGREIGMITPFLFLLLSWQGASAREERNEPLKTVSEGAVSIEDKGPYYFVTLDYTSGISPRQMGEEYGRCILKIEPDYEAIVGYYMFEIATLEGLWGNTIPQRLRIIRPQLQPFFRDELDGIASVMKGSWSWNREEIVYCFNMIPDLFRANQCSAFGCWGEASSNGKNIVYRTLDWFGGLLAHELPAIQCITRIRYPGRTLYLVGALGHLACITGINLSTGIMGGILDADVSSAAYDPTQCRSYSFDLREQLERSTSMAEIASEMTKTENKYAFSHLILLADARETRILENDISGTGTRPARAVRYDTSVLNPGVIWGYRNMVAAVNCFMLMGQTDNFATGKNAKINQQRWSLLLEKLHEKLSGGENKLTPENVRGIMCSFHGTSPGSLLLNKGDLYNLQTQQMMLFIPAENYLKVYFKPKEGTNQPDPSAFFYTIALVP
jgi:hypothetical protein